MEIKALLLNHSFVKLECEPAVARELSDYFSFFVPGYRFMPKYKSRMWDGKIRLFSIATQLLPAGLFPYVEQYAKARNYTLTVLDGEYGTPLDQQTISDTALSADLRAYDAPYEVRPYQHAAVREILTKRRVLTISPTGSGKSFIIYLVMRWILDHEDGNVLIVVPTTQLVDQMYSDFEEYGFDVSNNVHKIRQGLSHQTDKRVIISTWQSIYKKPATWFQQFVCVVGDECHGFTANSLNGIANNCTEASYKIGTTGSLQDAKAHTLVIEGLFGPTNRVVSTAELQQQEVLAKLTIHCPLLTYSDTAVENAFKVTKQFTDYKKELEFLFSNQKRTAFIAKLACSQTQNTLVLFRERDHGQQIFNEIKQRVKPNRRVFYVDGNTDTSERERIRKLIEKSTDAILVASIGTTSTGVNIKNLDVIIFGAPLKSPIKVLQSIGRGLRKASDDAHTTLFDPIDYLKRGKKQNIALKHGAFRQKLYKREQFSYKTLKVQLEK